MDITTPMRAIRLKCYDCSGWNWAEVAACNHEGCILFPYRGGKRPRGIKPRKISAGEYSIVSSTVAQNS